MNGGDKVFGLVSLSISLFVIVSRYYSSSSKDKQKKKSEQELHSWSELNRDVLGEIVSRLCVTDQARFVVVCKNWLAAALHPITTKSSSLPWHGCIIPGSLQFQIFDPFSSAPNHPASIQNLSWSNLGIPSHASIQNISSSNLGIPSHASIQIISSSNLGIQSHASIQIISSSNLGIQSHASIQIISSSHLGIQSPPSVFILDVQHNWLFLSFKKPLLSRRYSLLFSPFTKKVITLPVFHHRPRANLTATFSTQPDSPNCVYCMIDADSTDKISVITYRNGDKEWTARQFNKVPGVPGFQTCLYHPLILDGIIYIVSPFGQVASYNILNGEFNFDCLVVDALLVQNARSKRGSKVFVLNEEPMILCYDPEGEKDVNRPGKQCIKKYDRSRKVWIPATTLLGYTLFFSQKIFNVSLINTKGRRNNGVLSNKIYHFVNGGCHVYSLENGNLVPFKSINSNLLEDGGCELPEYKYNNGIPDTDVILAYWLKPPCVRSSSHN